MLNIEYYKKEITKRVNEINRKSELDIVGIENLLICLKSLREDTFYTYELTVTEMYVKVILIKHTYALCVTDKIEIGGLE